MSLIKDMNPPLVVIGMHRSGTSFLTRILEHSGIFMGILQSGVNEARYFLKKNIEILKTNGLRYDTPGPLTDLSSVSFEESGFKRNFLGYPFRPSLLRKLTKEGGEWGWKDPRNTYTLPYWLQVFPEMKVIHIYRNGIDVALSFYKRNSKMRSHNKYYSDLLNDKVEALRLWEKYVETAEGYANQLKGNFCTLKYEDLILMEPGEVKKLHDFIGMDVSDYLQGHSNQSRANSVDMEKLKDDEPELYAYAISSPMMKKLGYV